MRPNFRRLAIPRENNLHNAPEVSASHKLLVKSTKNEYPIFHLCHRSFLQICFVENSVDDDTFYHAALIFYHCIGQLFAKGCSKKSGLAFDCLSLLVE